MALKLNIRPEIEEEMDHLLPAAPVRSKTDYINQAIKEYNQKLKRSLELTKLKFYFKKYQAEGKEILSDFQKIRKNSY